ncbi:MAG: glycine cleavage system protein GcvH [Desulfovibrio sp.]|jgi:glycine cleavage system H protein|nr:glycine cleavage system protein GcvH [Desulfovibrio sp.]
MSQTPTELRYTKTHEWLRQEGGEAVFGITWFAQDALGDITYVELPRCGDEVKAGQPFGSIESVKAASDLMSPASGTVIAVNDALENAPETVNADPYGEGWMVRVALPEKAGLPKDLMEAGAYQAHCEKEH